MLSADDESEESSSEESVDVQPVVARRKFDDEEESDVRGSNDLRATYSTNLCRSPITGRKKKIPK